MRYRVRKPLFWGTASLVSLYLAFRFVSENWNVLTPIGFIGLTLVQVPVFFGAGGACGWLLAAGHAVLAGEAEAPEGSRASGRAMRGVGPVVIAATVGSCSATTAVLLVGQWVSSLSGDAAGVLWVAVCLAASAAMVWLFKVTSGRESAGVSKVEEPTRPRG
jgi:hypothetical protein